MAKNKHLTDAERIDIEHFLKERMSIKQIAAKIGKSTSTISREIRARAVPSDKTAPHRIRNRCLYQEDCQKRSLCENKPDCTKLCRQCNHCNNLCSRFEEKVCPKLSFPPYVCNGCLDERSCVLRRRYYINRLAHKDYRQILVESRLGANISEDELLALDELVSPLIRQGQSVHHITVNNPDQFNVSEKTIYRYIAGGLLKARNIDMPRVCRLKPRRHKSVEHKVDKACRIGRSYSDFQEFLVQSGDVNVVEMDSVLGRIGGKVLLTLLFKSCDLMLAFLRDRNTSQSVIDVFSMLDKHFGIDRFRTLFPVLLTDNGSEFSNPKAIEFGVHGNQRTRVFYCNPYASYQKPHVELSHELIRKVLPKGSSFDHLTQAHIDLMMSHVNSYSREKWSDKAPFDVFSYLYGHDILEKLGMRRVPANEIVLRPSLLQNVTII